MKKYILSCSFGKDSTALLLMLIEKKYPLDEVVFYDTGMEFNAIYKLRDKLLPILEENKIKYVELKPKNSFLYDMLERPVLSKQKGKHFGYGWCGGLCRWGTKNKTQALDKYAKENNALVYVGIAYDEPERFKRLTFNKLAPLCEWKVSESKALEYCFKHKICWHENNIELYSILDRVSCWCCCNKNKKELLNIRKFLPEYWQKLLELQRKINRPMKKFKTDYRFGDLGNLINLEFYLTEQENYNLFNYSYKF